jgi:hypothetical protein
LSCCWRRWRTQGSVADALRSATSAQIPLARNVIHFDAGFTLDPIDA